MRGPKSFCHKVTLKRKPVKELISKSFLVNIEQSEIVAAHIMSATMYLA
jgi:hypothetical protein